MPEVPRLSAEQRAGALVVAIAGRTARAHARADLKAGRISLAELLDQARTDEQLASMRVPALLDALPGYGKVRAAALLRELKIAESRRIRGLGPHQRAALLQRISQAAQSRS
ncbi:integration host factor, actinobacterial type [Jatrophihabitans sp.]|uniref:integration host factor, actinobacterial type n=1 Tax=Jatrophihabitans sp. TaxID=1932789 RepID=UPI002BB701B3|nr:integration host factor, actinobacterial type [Jatrophihabitans sp.]